MHPNERVGVHLVGSQRQLSELKISPTFPDQVYLQLKKVQCHGEEEDGRRCRECTGVAFLTLQTSSIEWGLTSPTSEIGYLQKRVRMLHSIILWLFFAYSKYVHSRFIYRIVCVCSCLLKSQKVLKTLWEPTFSFPRTHSDCRMDGIPHGRYRKGIPTASWLARHAKSSRLRDRPDPGSISKMRRDQGRYPMSTSGLDTHTSIGLRMHIHTYVILHTWGHAHIILIYVLCIYIYVCMHRGIYMYTLCVGLCVGPKTYWKQFLAMLDT